MLCPDGSLHSGSATSPNSDTVEYVAAAMGLRPASSRIIYDYTQTHIVEYISNAIYNEYTDSHTARSNNKESSRLGRSNFSQKPGASSGWLSIYRLNSPPKRPATSSGSLVSIMRRKDRRYPIQFMIEFCCVTGDC